MRSGDYNYLRKRNIDNLHSINTIVISVFDPGINFKTADDVAMTKIRWETPGKVEPKKILLRIPDSLTCENNTPRINCIEVSQVKRNIVGLLTWDFHQYIHSGIRYSSSRESLLPSLPMA